jgi:hypothetical protein
VTYKFLTFEVTPSPAYASGVISRPVIPIWVGVHDRPRKPFFGLLDTGSDDTKLPLSVAKRLGVVVDEDHPVLFHGVGGYTVGYYGELVLELRQSPKSWVWGARVAFLPDSKESEVEGRITLTLGHAGFFRHFHVGFDYQRARVRIRPDGLFVGRRV